MRSLENIVTDPANGNSPEFIAEKLGLAPVLVRCADDMAPHNMELAKLPELGAYVPEGWQATTASILVPIEMTKHDGAFHGMGNNMISIAMLACFQDRQGMPVRGKEFGLAIDQRGKMVSIRGYERLREEMPCELIEVDDFEDLGSLEFELPAISDNLVGPDFDEMLGDPGSDERIEGLREFFDGQELGEGRAE